ncbi:MAG: hypothetical protein K8R76_05695 [Candidatus Aegiribacteria sp.]|nr:hypothetical protein [Candidatus Aegiribacteria sp.]
MTLTARKYAWLNRISPKFRQLAGLYILEISVILSWTLLLEALFSLLSGNWQLLLPVSYLLSATMLAWLEKSRIKRLEQSPFEALGLAEISVHGYNPSEWQTLRRLLFTPPLILSGIGLIPVPRKKMTLLQLISDTKIVPLNVDMDPRTKEEIQSIRNRALLKVIAYTITSLIVTAIIVFVPPGSAVSTGVDQHHAISRLPQEEEELLAAYLELKTLYPDSIEFHVRLASLYYRNNMEADLVLELEEVRRLDPDHSILLLGEDLSVSMEDLKVDGDSTSADSTETFAYLTPITQETEENSLTGDSDSLQAEPVPIELNLIASDSIRIPDDTVFTDSTTLPVETLSDSIIIPEIDDSLLLPSLPDRSSVTEPQDSLEQDVEIDELPLDQDVEIDELPLDQGVEIDELPLDQDVEIDELPLESEQEDSLVILPEVEVTEVEESQESAPETEIVEPEDTPEEEQGDEPPPSTPDPEGT